MKESYLIEHNIDDDATSSPLLVVEYPSNNKAVEAFTNDEYRILLSLPKVAFIEVNILVSKSL